MQHAALIQRLIRERDSFYLYDGAVIARDAAQLIADFPNAEFLYSVKTNPHPAVVRAVTAAGFGVDAASAGEVAIGEENGLPADRIYYSAPAKSDRDIAFSLGIATVTADSLGELARIDRIAESRGERMAVGVRINPDFTYAGPGGVPGKFGVDEQALFQAADGIRALEHIRVNGIHVHVKSQELDGDVLARYHANVLSLAARTEQALGSPLEWINLGGGLGIPYLPDDQPLDTATLGRRTTALIETLKAQRPDCRVFLESGRFVAGRAGVYCTRVMDVKTSYGKKFVLLSNTLNGFLRSSIVPFVTGYAGEGAAMNEPLFTNANPFRITVLGGGDELERVTLAGNLCAASDVVAKDVLLPKLAVGDVVVFSNAGSYAAALSPMQFASLTPPAEYFVFEDGMLL